MSFDISKEQQQAINHTTGPSLIIAGAGTGKTTVLTEKIRKIVVDEKINPENILALTFTEKAAFEMEERVDKILPYGYYQTWVMTFHGFADAILREHGLNIGLSPTYKILSEGECVMFLQNNLPKLKLNYFYSTGNPTGFISSALKLFSRLRDENISPEKYEKYANLLLKSSKDEAEKQEAEKTKELSVVYQIYQQLKHQYSYLDYADLIYYLVILLVKRKNVLALLQSQFKYGLIDEFQDTNIVQYDLIKYLFPSNKNPNLTVIGDDNQSIYKFRGASVSNILSFNLDYKKAKTFVLNTNYRSYQEILDSAYELISHNNPDTLESKLGISKKLVAKKGSRKWAEPQLLHGSDGDQEAELVVKEIIKLAEEENYSLNDFAVLVRAANHAKPIIQALERYGLPYQFLGPTLLYYKNEIRDLIALLRFLQNTQDSTNLFRVLSIPILKLERSELIYVLSFAKRVSRPLNEAILILKEISEGGKSPELAQFRSAAPLLKPETQERLFKAHALLIKLLQQTPQQSALQVLYSFLDNTGYLKLLSQVKSTKDEERLNNITRFFNKVKKMVGEYGEPSINEVIQQIDLSIELGDTPRVEDFEYEKNNAVNILTSHSAKGLEFKTVFIINLVSDRFPSRQRRESLAIPEALIKEILPSGNYHLQEERRLFYVSLTRAEDRVYLSYADIYSGGKRQKKISPFVLEALGLDNSKIIKTKTVDKEQLSIFALNKNPEFKKLTPKDYGIDKFSYSQIETFDRCAKQYEYRYLLKVPEPESGILSFGSSVHRALELFYKGVMKKQSTHLSTLLKHYEDSFIPLGYLSQYMQKQTFEHGKKLLTDYYEHFFNLESGVISVEKKFVLKLKNRTDQYQITGKIDRIDKNNNTYEIIDYKTGKKPKDSLLKKSLQLGLYALAAMDANLLGISKQNLVLTYYFLEKNEKFSISAQDKHLDNTKEKVLESLTKLKEGNYPTTVGRHCDWCPFKIICPAWET